MYSPIVVGYDGSPVSDLAVKWAAQTASIRGSDLHVVCVWNIPPTELGIGMGYSLNTQIVDVLRNEATAFLEQGVALAHEEAPDVTVGGQIHAGPVASTLVSAADEASMIVLGSHGRGGFTGMLLGSVSRQVAAHVDCPAVIVRPRHDPRAQEIVVGVDGSEACRNALEFAFDEARRRQYRLRVLHTWEVPPLRSILAVPKFTEPELIADFTEAEMQLTADALKGHQENYPDVAIIEDIRRGSPIDALREASRTAALVVVGSRGRGGFTGLLLGSVSLGITNHAECPVAVVR